MAVAYHAASAVKPGLLMRLPDRLDPRAILESVPDCIYLVNREWNFTYLNQRASNELGAQQTLVGRCLWDAFPEAYDSRFGAAFRLAMSEDKIVECEDFYAPLGHWYTVTASPALDGLAVYFRNITEHKKNELAVAEGERRFRSMFETLTQGVIFQDSEGRITDANPSAERILGVSLEEMKIREANEYRWQMLDADRRPITTSQIANAMSLRTGKTVCGFVVEIFNPQRGEHRWLSVDAVPQFAPGETSPSHLFTLFYDITEQKRVEKALRDSQAHLAAAQRVASVGSTYIDYETGVWEWSDETFRIYGQSKASFSPSLEAIAALIHPEDRALFLDGIETARQGEVPHPVEYRIVRPDGQVRIIYREADLIRDKAGNLVGNLGTQSDITELRAAERQREMLQSQLYHAQRLDALGTLASGIAHDLNNTLVPILGLSEAMLKALPGANPHRLLVDVIHQAGVRARDLVKQILAFSRRENPDNEVLDLGPFMQDTMRLARASMPATIAILDRFAAVPPIIGDRSQLHQVILNLIANAAHAIGDADGTITVELANVVEAPGDRPARISQAFVQISVSDTGCGMDDDIKKRIFEPFFTTKMVGVGTGLGLSVVHGIVAAHGGRIEVKSAPGRGSRFDVFLPALTSGTDRRAPEGDAP